MAVDTYALNLDIMDSDNGLLPAAANHYLNQIG